MFPSQEPSAQLLLPTENFMMDDDPVWYPLGGMENVFRLNSELPHKRTPQSGILRSAYRAELEVPIEWSQNPTSSSSMLGYPRSPNSNTPSAQGSSRKVCVHSFFFLFLWFSFFFSGFLFSFSLSLWFSFSLSFDFLSL